jgi:O-antigen ligase
MTGTHQAKRTPLDTSIIVSTLLLLVALPIFLDTTRNRDWGVGLFVLLVSLLSALWSFSQLSKTSSHNRVWSTALPMVVLLGLIQAWAGFQYIAGISTDLGATAHSLILGTAYTLLFILVCGVFHTRKRLTLLISTLLVSATLQAFYGSLMTLTGIEWQVVAPKEVGQGNATGTFYNRNHLAGYLEMTLGLGIGLLLAFRDGADFRWRNLLELLMGPKARIRLALVIMVIALVMTRSRMGNTGFVSSLVVVGAIYILINKTNRKRNAVLLASFIAIDVLIISQFFGLEKLADRLVNTQFENQVEMSVGDDGAVVERIIKRENVQRDDVLVYALPAIKERWMVGWGAGSFWGSFQQFTGPDVYLDYDHAHNDYVEFLYEYGAIGFSLLGLFALLALFNALRALWNLNSWYRSGIGFGSSMAIIAILVHSSTDFNLQVPANAATFIVVCAIAVLANTHRKVKAKKQEFR